MQFQDFLTQSRMPFVGAGAFFLVLMIIWSLIWKGLALWRSAKRNDTVWFVIFLVVNTVGVLEIIYLYLVAPDKKTEK